MRSSRPSAGWVLASLLVFLPRTSYSQVCTHPSLDSLLESNRSRIGYTGTYFPEPAAESLLSVTGRDTVQWLAVSWYGVDSGVLFALSCRGEVRALRELGAFTWLKPGPVLPRRGKTVFVRVETGSGTGWLRRHDAIAAVVGDTVVVIGSWLSYEHDFVIPTEQHTKDSVLVRFDSTGRVTTSGVRWVYDSSTGPVDPERLLRSERIGPRYSCYRSEERRYGECSKGAPGR